MATGSRLLIFAIFSMLLVNIQGSHHCAPLTFLRIAISLFLTLPGIRLTNSLKQFLGDGGIYEEGQDLEGDPNSSRIKKWIREWKIAPLKEKPILTKEGDPDFSKVQVLNDINVAGRLGDYRLKKGQIIYIEKEQLPMPLKRGAVKEIGEGDNP